MGEGREMVKANSSFRMLTPKRTPQAYIARRTGPAESAPVAGAETEQALSVVVLYQDSLTRHWATELWDRVGKLIDIGGICSESWKLSDLARGFMFEGAVRAAAEADVLVVSVCDTGELPLLLHSWIDAWMPRRAGRAGALVALIGVPARLEALPGRAHDYLEAVAHQAGLDFLPRERRLPENSVTRTTLPQRVSTTGQTRGRLGAGPNHSTGTGLGWELAE
jgi:hypothetical protein